MGTAASRSGSASKTGQTASSKSTPRRATQRSSRRKGSSYASPNPYQRLWAGFFAAEIKGSWEPEKLTEENIFVAFIEMLGFKRKKRGYPHEMKREYILDEDEEDGVRVYELSGGPMIVFSNTGKFEDWS